MQQLYMTDDQSTLPPPTSPPLSVKYLLVWTTFTALLIICRQLPATMLPQARHAVRPTDSAVVTFESMLNAANIGGLLIFLFRRRPSFVLKDPGHWLLVMQGATLIVSVALNLAYFLVYRVDPDFGSGLVVSIVDCAVGVLLYLVPAIEYRGERSWKLYFWLETFVNLAYGVMLIGIITSNWTFTAVHLDSLIVVFIAAMIVPLIVVALLDLVMRRRRDWLHWLGVFTLAGTLLTALLSEVFRG
jgi:hypothetical protein